MIDIIVVGKGINPKTVKYSSKVFTGGEVQVKLDIVELCKVLEHQSVGDVRVVLDAHLKTPTDVIELLMVTGALRSVVGPAPISLIMPYVPYARQDRVCDDGEALAIKVFADLINSQNYEKVTICDPHSDVTPALINNVNIVEQWRYLYDVLESKPKEFVLVAPDAGAIKKVTAAAKHHADLIHGVVRADKTRDVRTGAITDTKVYSDHIGDKSFLILDDICDGGRTFNELAKVLAPLTDGEVHLFVTHGIFSYGFNALEENIDHIWTGHSFVDLRTVSSFVTEVQIR